MGVNVVALLHVTQNLVVVGLHALALQLIVAALGTYLGRGGDKDLQFSIGEDHRTDVTTIHHHTAVAAHLLLLGNHGLTHKTDGGNGTDAVAHLHGADFLLHEFAVQIGVRPARLRVELKGYVDIGHTTAQLLFVDDDLAAFLEQSVAQGKEGDAAVHGSCIHIHITYFTGKVLGHRAFSARAVTVNSNGNLLHYLMFLS